MQHSEQEFCRDQSIRLLKLAKECPDPQTRDHLIVMANEWLERADATDRLAKSAQCPRGEHSLARLAERQLVGAPDFIHRLRKRHPQPGKSD